MKFVSRLLFALVVIISSYSVSASALKIDASEHANPWTQLNIRDDPNRFQFAVVADRTGGARPGVFEKAVDKLNLLQPQFVLCVGDLIQGYTEDINQINFEWDQFDAIVQKLNMPFFYLPGNHDISNPSMASVWQSRFGRTYYHFLYRNTLFLFLNTEDPSFHHISSRQIDYFRKVLSDNQNVRWIIIFMHEPMWQGNPTIEWINFESLLNNRPCTFFAGHHHTYTKTVIEGRDYYTLATTGGAVKDPNDRCTFDHIAWVTMTDAGPQLSNLLLDGILTDQPCPQH